MAPRIQELKQHLLVLALTALCNSCTASDNLLGSSSEPAFYLVLTRDLAFTESLTVSSDSSLYALLTTASSPAVTTYRDAQRFEMLRQSDGAAFAWRSLPRSGAVEFQGGSVIAEQTGNYVLNWSGDIGTLGKRDLIDGASYDLDVLTGNRQLVGTTVLPSHSTMALQTGGGGAVVSWSRSTGAAAYLLSVDTDFPGAVLTTDTSYSLRLNIDPKGWPPVPVARLIAIDKNLHQYILDTTMTRSGISSGFGVFGGVSRTTINLPTSLATQSAARGAVAAVDLLRIGVPTVRCDAKIWDLVDGGAAQPASHLRRQHEVLKWLSCLGAGRSKLLR